MSYKLLTARQVVEHQMIRDGDPVLTLANGEKIRVYSSPNLDGYHIYIHLKYWVDWSDVIKLRRRYKDDPKRLINDLFKTNPENKMIMFSDKDGKKEIFIAEYWPQPEFIFPKIIS